MNRVTRQLKPASNDSKTPVGNEQENSPQLVAKKEALNQIFELFRFNYHNQFIKAFPDANTLTMAKRLWLRLLDDYSDQVIMRAAEKTVKESSWLPSVHDVLKYCDEAETLGLPSAYQAYIEACRAPSPKKEYAWTHPIIYFAGAATDWFFLANNPEQSVFPVFKRNYEILLKRLNAGEEITLTIPKALPEEVDIPLSNEEHLEHLERLKALLQD